MASIQSSETLKSRMAVTHYDFDPGATTLTDIAWVDMQNYGAILVSFFRTIGTGAIVFKLIGNTASNGGGTDVTVKEHAVASEPDAVGDYIFLECTAEELRAAGANYRYISAQISTDAATDEGVVTYIRTDPRFATTGLTADVIA